jgi:hypothetical protein
MDRDEEFVRAFVRAAALDHPGFDITVRGACGADCAREFDVCLCAKDAQVSCGKPLILGNRQPCGDPAGEKHPSIYKYAGVSAILAEVRRLTFDRLFLEGDAGAGGEKIPANLPRGGALICAYSLQGGAGTSCCAIGVGRELARYRDKKTLYLSLEDYESKALSPGGGAGMRAEEMLYRYFRLTNRETPDGAYYGLLQTAFAPDAYGLLRLKPDRGFNSLSALGVPTLCTLLALALPACEAEMTVLDFGTRLRFLKAFSDVTEPVFLEVRREAAVPDAEVWADGENLFGPDVPRVAAEIPFCPEDVYGAGGHVEVSLANTFGLAIKETADRLLSTAEG